MSPTPSGAGADARRGRRSLIDTVAVLPYAAIGAVHADPVDPMPVNENHALLSELPTEAVEALLALTGPGSGSAQTIVELRLLGGALAREPQHRSAFCHRDAAFSQHDRGAHARDRTEWSSATQTLSSRRSRRGRPAGRCPISPRPTIRPARRGCTPRTPCTGSRPWLTATTRPGCWPPARSSVPCG